MVDFKKLRTSGSQATVIDPIEIFRRLPKPAGINDLYTSQAHVLEEWFGRREEQDIVIKLHTGGGKTLVGLLIAQSTLSETQAPVIYLTPTVQLVEQTLAKAAEYSIPAVPYERNADLPGDFLAGRSVLVCTYQALFNGRSKFGIKGGASPAKAGAIVLDDAHTAFSAMRESFTLRVEKDKSEEDYAFLTNLFRGDFADLGKLGTFDDVVSGVDYSVLEVPYWGWVVRLDQVRAYLRDRAESYPFAWPFLRDAFEHCHCLIGPRAFVITPILPLVDLVPTYAECPRRVFMSATIADDSAIVRSFDARPGSISKPIASKSLAGVSERMLLAPELMKFPIADAADISHRIAKWMAEKHEMSTVVLTPSHASAQTWSDVATVADSTARVAECVRELQQGRTKGPVAFANRYDGIDLPGDACRVLILSGLPRGTSEYDTFRSASFLGSSELTSALAQRLEQGMGRGARGGGDFCVVILTGKDLITWIDQPSHHRFLTSSTRAQLQIGLSVGAEVSNLTDMAETMLRCLTRDKDWIEYHAETLAALVQPDPTDPAQIAQAAAERKYFGLVRGNYFERAITSLDKYSGAEGLDDKSRGWLQQLVARAALQWGDDELAQRHQQTAYALNSSLLRPRVAPKYVPLAIPGKQAEAIVARMSKYGHRRSYLVRFEDTVTSLVPEASSNQFEEALATLGSILGFSTQRPDNQYRVGPDVLWLTGSADALVIEAKSRKKKDNALTKDEHGQLLNAAEWFKEQYPGHRCVRVSVHPNATASPSVVAGDSRALTFEGLNSLVANTRQLLTELSDSAVGVDELTHRCEGLLEAHRLTPDAIAADYLVPFQSITLEKGT